MADPRANAFQAEIEGHDFSLERVQVIQGLYQLPQLQFCFLKEEPHVQKLRQWHEENVEGKVAGLGVRIASVRPNRRSRSAWLIHATVGSRELMDWLEAVPSNSAGQVLVYQRSEKDSSASRFVNRTTGNRFLDFPPGVSLESVFTPQSIILRPGGLNNRHFLDLLTNIMRSHDPSVLGWTAFDRIQQPFALLTTEWPGVTTLDQEWDWVPQEPDHSFSGDSFVLRYRRYVTCENQAQVQTFIHSLCQRGRAPIGLPTIAGPGLVRLGSHHALCRRVIHSFDHDTLKVQIDVEVVSKVSAPPSYYSGPGICLGKFIEWVVGDNNEHGSRLAKLAPCDGRWAVMSEDQTEAIDETGTLRTWLLTPAEMSIDQIGDALDTPASGRGIYIRHPTGIIKKLSLQQTCQPGALGEAQCFHAESEKRDITVSGRELGIVVPSPSASAKDFVGIALNEQQVLAQVGADDFVEIGSQKVRVARLQVDKQLKVNP